MTTDKGRDTGRAEEGALAPWFEAGRDAPPEPGGDWLARMEAMALAEQPALRSAPERTAVPRPPLWREALRLLGGWPAVAGLAAACAAGIWIGVASPQGIADLLPVTAGDSMWTLEPASGFDYAMVGL